MVEILEILEICKLFFLGDFRDLWRFWRFVEILEIEKIRAKNVHFRANLVTVDAGGKCVDFGNPQGILTIFGERVSER